MLTSLIKVFERWEHEQALLGKFIFIFLFLSWLLGLWNVVRTYMTLAVEDQIQGKLTQS